MEKDCGRRQTPACKPRPLKPYTVFRCNRCGEYPAQPEQIFQAGRISRKSGKLRHRWPRNPCHIFQRPAQLGVKFYQAAGEAGEPAVCKRCGGRFASRMHIEDLNRVLPQVGFDYRIEESQFTWQEICPACKRKSLSLAQLRLREEAHG